MICTNLFRFNWAARKLDKRLKQLGALEIIAACEADEQGDEGYFFKRHLGKINFANIKRSTDGSVLAWSQAFRSRILNVYPLDGGRQPIPNDVPMPTKWRLQMLETNSGPNTHSEGLPKNAVPQADQIDQDSYNPTSTFRASLRKNDRVTPSSHWQDVRFLSLTTEQQIYYQPGDALAIMPVNKAEDVDAIIHQMAWSEYADAALEIVRARPSQATSKEVSAPTAWPSKCRNLTLRGLLTSYFDFTAIPRRSFFAKIANYTEDVSHKERLLEFTSAEYLDEYYDYATRPRRSILEVLQEFESVRIPWKETVNVLPPLRPRQFSIASGGALRNGPNGGTTFELLVAVVKYRTVIKKLREGLCTRYLAALPVGTSLNLELRTEGRFSTRSELQPRYHVMIGAGTGIAPLRSLIHEKRAFPGGDHGIILIFGARSAASDFFFEEEWAAMNASDIGKKNLHIVTAFSRDQRFKIYVQDRIRDNSDLIYNALCINKATVVICGSSGQMPKAVREALVDVLVLSSSKAKQAHSPATREEARLYLANMEKQKRYLQETW